MSKSMNYSEWEFYKNNLPSLLITVLDLDIENKIRETFPNLVFNEELHKYTVNDKPMTSVSHTIGQFAEKFDSDLMADRVAKKRTRLGTYTTKEEVLQEWEDKKNFACDKGTRVHLFGEDYPTKGGICSDGYEIAVKTFWDTLPPHILPVGFELQMYSEEMGIAGTSDILLYNTKTGNFIIADYKTNEDLFKNFKGKKLLGRFNHLLDMPFSKYTLQLSYYQILFERTGFKVENRLLIWLKPDGTFTNYWLDDVTDLILNE